MSSSPPDSTANGKNLKNQVAQTKAAKTDPAQTDLAQTGPVKLTPKGAELIVEADVGPEISEFQPEQARTINELVASITKGPVGKVQAESWLIARKKIEYFRPLPWFLWRLSLSVFSKPVGSEEINEGMVLGLRRLMFAAASDPILGAGGKINSVKKALSILHPDVIAAASVVHSVCRRLNTYHHDSIWRPILDEALVQAQIGFEMGVKAKNIGRGRGLLSGFAGQIGLAILVACGDKKQAAETIDKLSAGQTGSVIGSDVYGCEPLQVSAMLLAASGCGPDAANGIAISGSKSSELEELEGARATWAASCHAVEFLRRAKGKEITPEIYFILGIDATEIEGISKRAIKIARAGHSWHWIE